MRHSPMRSPRYVSFPSVQGALSTAEFQSAKVLHLDAPQLPPNPILQLYFKQKRIEKKCKKKSPYTLKVFNSMIMDLHRHLLARRIPCSFMMLRVGIRDLVGRKLGAHTQLILFVTHTETG